MVQRRGWIGAIAVGLAIVGGLARAEGPPVVSRAAEVEVVVEKDQTISMRDGVKLAVDLYRPAKGGKPVAGKFPALLTRTPYNKAGTSGEGRYYAERGYVVVANDIRGRYSSEGTWRLIADDPQDGFDVVE